MQPDTSLAPSTRRSPSTMACFGATGVLTLEHSYLYRLSSPGRCVCFLYQRILIAFWLSGFSKRLRVSPRLFLATRPIHLPQVSVLRTADGGTCTFEAAIPSYSNASFWSSEHSSRSFPSGPLDHAQYVTGELWSSTGPRQAHQLGLEAFCTDSHARSYGFNFAPIHIEDETGWFPTSLDQRSFDDVPMSSNGPLSD